MICQLYVAIYERYLCMTRILLSTALLLSTLVHAQNTEKRSISIPEINDAEIIIDGQVSPLEWRGAAVLEGFEMFWPEPGKEPLSQKSSVYMLYTQKGIYIAGIFRDSTATILKQLTPRDEVDANTDWVVFKINPFNDGQNDFNFYLTAAGVQGDSRSTDFMEDAGWNAVWNSAVHHGEHFWSCEVYIPFRAIRIPEGEAKPWGFNVKRSRRSDRSSYSWNQLDRNFPNESLQSGLLTGIKVENPPLRLSMRPNATLGFERNGQGDQRTLYAAGADVKYGINKSFTLDMTLLPDFSQVAYDQQFVNFKPFEQQFSENRQFFKEGVNTFNKAGLFYSRRIGGNPKNFSSADLSTISNTTQNFTRMLNATKLTGTIGSNLSVGTMNAITAPNYVEGLDSNGQSIEILAEPLTNYNITAFDQRIGGNSSVGMINTHVYRQPSDGIAQRNARVTALTYNTNILNNSYNLNGYVSNSQVSGDNPSTGFEVSTGIDKQVGAWLWGANNLITDTQYDPNDLGFLARGNRVHNSAYLSKRILKPTEKWMMIRSTVRLEYNFLYENLAYERFNVNINHMQVNKGFTAFGYNANWRPLPLYDYYEPRVWGRYNVTPLSLWNMVWISTDYRKPYAFDGRLGGWWWDDLGARGMNQGTEHRFRINDHLNLYLAQSVYSAKNELGWLTTVSPDSIGYAGRNILNVMEDVRLEWLFGPNSYLSVKALHSWNRVTTANTYHLEQDGSLTPSDRYQGYDFRFNVLNVDIKYVLWFAPGRELNILYRISMADADDQAALNYWQNMMSIGGIPADQVLSLRCVYFLDYQQIAPRR